MSRYTPSKFRSFAGGLLLAGLPVLAFVGVDYLLGVPVGGVADTGSTETDVGRFAPSSARPYFVPQPVLQHAGTLPSSERSDAASPRVQLVATTPSGAKGLLIANIQKELWRVGCYAGDADGIWNDRTRVAMRSFNESVHVNLATDQPDYLLLTLLQGHNAKACLRACDLQSAHSNACVDRSIEARVVAPTVAASPQAIAASSTTTSWTTSVVVAEQRPIREPAGRVASGSQGRAATPSQVRTESLPVTTHVRTSPPATLDRQPAASGPDTSERMALGGQPPSAARAPEWPVANSPLPPTVVRETEAAQRVRSRPSPAVERSRPSQTASRDQNRLRRTFSDLGHAAP